MNEVNVLSLPFTQELENVSVSNFIAYYSNNKSRLEGMLEKNGVVKFTGININSIDDFQFIVNSISDKFLNYIDGNSPRTKLSSHVYTSTEYDKTQRITMHNELSYSATWPGKLFFTCLTPAETGGETLLADSRVILERMDKDIVSEIDAKGILYTRNLHGGKGIGQTWQETFETTNRQEVESFCRSRGIDYEWMDGEMLRLKQLSPGIIRHRTTGEKVWFNQIDQFHPYQLGEEMYEALKLVYGSPDNFPTYVAFGDGTRIDESMVNRILHTIREVTLEPRWQKNELLILDNELVAHGRNPYTGDRRVLVAMSR
jgi:alpha-ketoglutarate-dependent taurine dioxygenase